ncbi:MAG: hypothetical protein FI718_06875 [SAR202 cluster bacterium]|nr:hypothetical protein [SAR202 cluster bacterium]
MLIKHMGFKRISSEVSKSNLTNAVIIDYNLKDKKRSPVIKCDICGLQFTDVHCKLKCTKCGYMRDCSDP